MSVNAGGDIVGGDKTTTITQTTTVQHGFAGEPQKQEFLTQIAEMQAAMEGIKALIVAQRSLSADDKKSLVDDIVSHLGGLQEAQARAATAPVGQAAPPELVTTVETALNHTGGIIDKVKAVAEKAGPIAAAVGAMIAQYGPLILKAKAAFGGA